MKGIAAKIFANFPLVWVPTAEYERFSQNLAVFLSEKAPEFSVFRWDIERGLYKWIPEGSEGYWTKEKEEDDPKAPIAFGLNQRETVIILYDYDRFLSSVEIVRALLNAVSETEGSLVTFVIVSPNLSIPAELERYVSVEDFELPTESELLESLKAICEVNEIPVPEDAEKIARTGKGLTLFEFSRAVTLSVVSTGKIDKKFITAQKEELIRKNPVLELYHPENLDEIKGLERAREFIRKAVKSGIGRGVMLLGVPGTGKSLLAKTMGKELGLPVVMLNFESVFDRYVGSSEQKIREALKTIDTVAPCIVFIGEIEKGLSGLQSSGHTDGGTTARVFGSFLKWLNDRTSETYVIATSNDVSKLPPEFLRAERWDAIFFVDLPTEETLRELLDYYSEKFGLSSEQRNLSPKKLEGFSGAEIRTLCRTARILSVPLSEAVSYVKPLSKTMGEKIKELREWAKNRCVMADSRKQVEQKKAVRVKAGKGLIS